MRILFVVFEGLLGGHVLSATTVAREIQSRGHHVMFAGKSGRMTPAIKETMPFFEVEIPIFHGMRQTYFTWRSFSAVSKLRQLICEQQVEFVHAFDAGSYMHVYLACLLEGIPVVCTLCGGIDPYYNLPIAPKIIVFSEEQQQRMIKTWGWPREKVEVIRTRLDVKRILDPSLSISMVDLQKLDIDISRPKLFMLSSFGRLKIFGIHSLLDAVDLVREHYPIQMIFIGGSESSDNDVVIRAKMLNEKYGDKTVILLDPVEDAFRFLEYADIVLGVGRSAFEGMVFGKPTIIVGNTGFAGVASPEQIDAIAYYNFSGRNRFSMAPKELLANEIVSQLTNDVYRTALGEFGKSYVMQEFDVRRGGEKLEKVYKEVDSQRLSFLVQSASFVFCLFPIMLANILHRPKTLARAAINRFISKSKTNKGGG